MKPTFPPVGPAAWKSDDQAGYLGGRGALSEGGDAMGLVTELGEQLVSETEPVDRLVS